MNVSVRRLSRSMLCATGLVLLLLGARTPASAAPSDCAKIDEDAQRLACYDKAFPRSTPQPASTQAPGQWKKRSAPSILAGKTNQTVSLASDSDVQCRWSKPRRVQLNVQCKDNVTSISFETGCYMTSSEYRNYGYVTYQLDKANPRIAHMVAGPDNHSLGFWSGDTAISYIRELLGKSRLKVKMTPYAEDPISTSFNIAGLEEALKPVRKECGW